MTNANTETFTVWLKDKLRELNTDENIFGSYILGILEGDETEDEKQDALQGILSEIETPMDNMVQLIFNKWYECHPKLESSERSLQLNVDEQLAKILEAQKLLPTVKERQYTEEEKRIREHILNQYSQTEVSDEDAFSDEEDTTKQGGAAAGAGSMSGIEKNTNFQDVMALQKEKREQARLESAAKKQKDKEDRDKQKQLREEKKEKRKTVKGERRR